MRAFSFPLSSQARIQCSQIRPQRSVARATLRRLVPNAILAVALLALSACASESSVVQAPESPQAEIPIRRVVLYQNGVGYFERSGKVEGSVLSLQIRPSQVNDLLKSLTIVDHASGRAVSVSLPLEKSGDRVLMELPPQVRNAEGLLGVLRVFRGARVSVETASSGSAEGRIVGVENLQAGQGEDVPADWRMTLRTDRGELKVFPVGDIEEVGIRDRTLSVGLEQSLDVALGEGSWKPLNLSVRLTGGDEHDLTASYIVEMPRWKPAYRIITGSASPLLQGWAIVDNVSGEDWRDVQLSLVSGTPMSFVYDLHSPQYTLRKDLTPRRPTQALAPPEELVGAVESSEAEMEESAADQYGFGDGPALSKKAKSRASGASVHFRAEAKEAPPPPAPSLAPRPIARLDDVLEEQGAVDVEGQQVSALFRYDLRDKVTVPDRSSTLVAIVNERVDADEVAYFRPELSGTAGHHPYRAVRFTNNTKYSLERGPVTLYAGGTFVGEGFLERCEPGSTQFVGFSLDQKLSLSTDHSTKEEQARLLRIVDGLLYSEMQRSEVTTYEIHNLNKEPVTAYIRTVKRPGWSLSAKPPRTVEMPDALAVPVVVPASGKASVPVTWTRKVERSIGINTELSTTLLQVYLKGAQVPKEMEQQLQEVLNVKTELSKAQRETARLRGQHHDLSKDQNRVRENLNTLRKTKGNRTLEQRLAAKLAQQETELGKLSGRLVELSEKQAGLEQKLSVLISGISLKAK